TIRGWATAVSLMVSASEVVPWATRSMAATAESQVRRSWKPGSSIQGVRKPGVWEPWPGQTMTSTGPAFRSRGREAVGDADELWSKDIEVSYNCRVEPVAVSRARDRVRRA